MEDDPTKLSEEDKRIVAQEMRQFWRGVLVVVLALAMVDIVYAAFF
jgi:hypothetical protein